MLRLLEVAAAASVLLFITAHARAQEQHSQLPLTQACSHVALEERPGWTISGSWSADNELIVVDARRNRLLWFDTDGQLQHDEAGDLRLEFREGDEDRFTPTAVAQDGDTVWLQLTGSRMAKLDETASRVEKRFTLDGAKVSDAQEVSFVFRWSLMEGGELLGFADLKTTSGVWSSGFFRLDLDFPLQAKVFREVSLDDPARLWYRLGHPYLASIGETAYVLDVGSKDLRILKSEPNSVGTTPLEAFPRAIRRRPELPAFDRPNDLVELMAEVEASTMPTGIYGWKGYLWIVWRRPGIEGQEWLLTKIDPERDKVEGTVILPSQAHHLLVVPGPHYWALVEKGVVRGWGTQSIDSMRLIPADLIESFPSGANICG